MTSIDTAKERNLWAARFEVAKRDDCLDSMIPSDLRGIITSGLRLIDALDAERAENERLREALLFYADSGKYPAPFTGGHGDLYFDCGQIARAALNPEGGA